MSALKSSINTISSGATTHVIAPGATIGELVPNLPGSTSVTVAPVPVPLVVSSAAPERPKDTRKQIRLTPEDPGLPEYLSEDSVIHLEGGMIFTQDLPKGSANVEVHAHSGSFIPYMLVGPHTSVTIDSGAMGTLVLLEGGSAYVANGGKVRYVEAGGYARCARDRDVNYMEGLESGPVELEITSGQSMTLHDGASARIHVHQGGYAYLVNANFGYGIGDMPEPTEHSTDIEGTVKVINGCVTDARVESGGVLICSDCCIERLHVAAGGQVQVFRGSVEAMIESGGWIKCKGVELDMIRAIKGATVKLSNCVRVFYRESDCDEEYFSVVGEEWQH